VRSAFPAVAFRAGVSRRPEGFRGEASVKYHRSVGRTFGTAVLAVTIGSVTGLVAQRRDAFSASREHPLDGCEPPGVTRILIRESGNQSQPLGA